MFESIFKVYFQALSFSRMHGLKSPYSYEIAYDYYRESLSCPHPPMQGNIWYDDKKIWRWYDDIKNYHIAQH